MYSTFFSADDAMLRVGDYVSTRDTEDRKLNQRPVSRQTTPGQGINESTDRNAPVSLPSFRHVQSRVDCKLKRPPGYARRSQTPNNTSHGTTNTTVQPPAPTGPSPTALLFGVDTSSPQSCWRSMTKGTWLCEEARHTHLVGVVNQIDEVRRLVSVVVWKRGGECDTSTKKSIETVPSHLLRKLSLQEFHKLCKNAFMHDMSHQLKLRGEGYDESAPLALIAYNNKIISNLIQKIDTSAKLSELKLERRPRSVTALRKMPIPTIVPVEDPLADAREELRALAAGGMMRKSAHGSNGGKDAGNQRVEEAQLKDVSRVASRQSQRGTVRLQPGTAGSGIFGEMSVGSGIHSSVSSSPNPTTQGNGWGREKDRGFSVGMDDLGISGQDLDGEDDSGQGYGSVVEAMVASTGLEARRHLSADFDKAREGISKASVQVFSGPLAAGKQSDTQTSLMCTLLDVNAEGTLLLRPKVGNTTPFSAKLAHVQLFVADVPKTEDAVSTLRKMKGTVLDVRVLERDVAGCASAMVSTESGELLQEALISQGLAVVCTDSALDLALAYIGGGKRLHNVFDRMYQAQDTAKAAKVGLWQDTNTGASYALGDISSTRTSPLASKTSPRLSAAGLAAHVSSRGLSPSASPNHGSLPTTTFLTAATKEWSPPSGASARSNTGAAGLSQSQLSMSGEYGESEGGCDERDPSGMAPLFTNFISSVRFRSRLAEAREVAKATTD